MKQPIIVSLKFVDEPPSYTRTPGTGAPPKWVDAVALMKQNPERWLVLEKFESSNSAYNLAWRIRHGHAAAFANGRWEAVVRANTVYVRYMGE